tara:strand:- start:1105 stop:1257 length:153 start_codon:yes stop_codon:yes gene_type:complete
MDRKLEEELKTLARRNEMTLEIIMDHFRETDERLEEMYELVTSLEERMCH